MYVYIFICIYVYVTRFVRTFLKMAYLHKEVSRSAKRANMRTCQFSEAIYVVIYKHVSRDLTIYKMTSNI